MARRALSYTLGGNVNWCSQYGKQYGGSYGGFLRTLKIELAYDLAIPLLSIYPDKTLFQKDTCTLYVHNSGIHNSQDREST